MNSDKKPEITIDDITYDIETFDMQQRNLLNHVIDLERKVETAKFNLDQLSVARDTFLNLLKTTLAERTVNKEVQDIEPIEAQ